MHLQGCAPFFVCLKWSNLTTFNMFAEQLRKPTEIGMFCNYGEIAVIRCMADTLNFAVFVACDSVSPFDVISVSSASLKRSKSALK